MQYQDRRQAGQLLGQALLEFGGQDPLVVGLPRGGVPVASEVARTLEAPLEIWMVRRLGVPDRPELGMGAVAEGPALYLDRPMMHACGATGRQIVEVVQQEVDELRQRAGRLRAGQSPPEVRGRTVILVDDGIATGGTVRAAIEGLRKHGVERLILAVPVAPPETVAALRPLVDAVVCPFQPTALQAIGTWYEDFEPVPDEQVVQLLELARRPSEGAGPAISRAIPQERTG